MAVMMSDIRFGPVCSGIEAASVAWHPLGWRAAWLSEIEPFPCAVLAHHYPEVENVGDMTRIADYIALGALEAPDVFCGGTPCQAFSVAGLRSSLDDARGNLSLTFCEIANEIDNARRYEGRDPAVIFWENVPGVLSTSDNAFGCFLAALAGEDDALVAPRGKWPNAGVVVGPKRTIAWRVFDAQYFGIPQRRRRVFVVASARAGFDPAAVLFESDGVRRDIAPSRVKGQEVTGTISSRTTGGGGLGTDFELGSGLQAVAGTPVATLTCVSNAEGAAPPVCLTVSNLSKTVNNQTPLLAYGFQPRIARNGRGDMGECVNALTAQAGETGKGDAAPCVAVAYGIRTANTSSNGWGIQENITHTLDTAMGVAVAFVQNSRDEVRLMGGDGDIVGALAAQTGAKQQCYVAAPIAWTEELTASVDVAGTIPRGGAGGRHDGGMNQQMQVRRLTPKECARLQGFPDTYLDITVRNKPAADGPKYKALGNSWAVPVIQWLGSRINEAL